VHLAWLGEDQSGTFWHVLDGTWSQPVQEGPVWSVRVDGSLRTRSTGTSNGPVKLGDGPTLGGSLRITSLDDLEDGMVAADRDSGECTREPAESGEFIVVWNDAAQRMR
jgi:hypothetical protein